MKRSRRGEGGQRARLIYIHTLRALDIAHEEIHFKKFTIIFFYTKKNVKNFHKKELYFLNLFFFRWIFQESFIVEFSQEWAPYVNRGSRIVLPISPNQLFVWNSAVQWFLIFELCKSLYEVNVFFILMFLLIWSWSRKYLLICITYVRIHSKQKSNDVKV